MRRAFAVAAVTALVAAPASTASLRVKGVDATHFPHVTVTVVASKRSGAPRLRENGSPVRGVLARNLGRDKSVVLAIDRSQSMKGRALADATAALRKFVASKPSSDRLALIGFGSKAVELTRFSSATIDADIALRDVTVDETQGTALYDTVVLGSRALRKEDSASRVLIVLTDGANASKGASRAAAIATARRSHVAVYTVGIESEQFSPAALRTIAASTGGHYFPAASSGALAAVYDRLAAELARTWRLEYVTSARPGEHAVLAATVPRVGRATARFLVQGDAHREDASSLVPEALYEGTFGTLLVASIAGLLALIAFLCFAAARRGSWLRNRLAPHVKTYAGDQPASEERERLAMAAELFQATERSLGHLRPWLALERMIERADIPLRTVQILYISLGAAMLFGLVVAVVGLPAPLILVAMALGGALPTVVVWFKARKRTKAFDDQLPDILLTIAGSLKAGHSFKQGIQTIVDDGEPPASKEFSRVTTEMQLGRPMDEALTDMAKRLGSANFEFVMTAVTVQRQVGGSLAGLFDTVAQTVRDRQQFARRIRSLTAMGRGSAYMLVALPFVLAGLLTLGNPEYMSPLYTTSTGHMLIMVGLTSMGVGSLILKKIVSFKG